MIRISLVGLMALLVASLVTLVVVVRVLPKLFAAVASLVGTLIAGCTGILRGAGGFVGREVREAMNLAGAAVTASITGTLALVNGLFGRGRSMTHYMRAAGGELVAGGASLYRLVIGHPARLLGLTPLVASLERRIPELIRRPPETSHGLAATDEFPGYRVVGTLPAGGSGARLFLAHPSAATRERFLASGYADPGQVVIKSFTLLQGSTVPQIVRESRALEAARRLGRVLDHHLEDTAFWYAMPYVPGDNLDQITRQMHARCSQEGLDSDGLVRVLGYSRDMLATLHEFHEGGLWHKDIKPSNLIVSSDRVHLVDLGLVTPLTSAMTLTTHGTEYYRDPELVRLAMKGVRVHDVDGVKFDLYSAGAVIYSMIEDSFPAQGSLSRINKRCPDALAWIVRRAMADVERRYGSAQEMGRDLGVLLAASDPFAVRPAELPSMGTACLAPGEDPEEWLRVPAPAAPAFVPDPVEPPAMPAPFARKSQGGARGAKLVATGAAGLLASATLAGGVLFWTAASHQHSRAATVSASNSGRAGARTVSVPAPTNAVQSPSGSVIVETPRSRSRGAPATPASFLRSEDLVRLENATASPRVLILIGVGVDTASPQVAQVTRELESEGFQLVGHPGDEAEESIELVARARRAVELGELGDAVAGAQLQRFLDRGPNDLAGVVWLAPGDSLGSVEHRLFVSGR